MQHPHLAKLSHIASVQHANLPAALQTAQGFLKPRGELPKRVPTILLAEDDDDLREVTSAILDMQGYQTIACCDAECALTIFGKTTTIDLLLTDLEMPGRSGVELARELTALRPSLPVMMVSGSLIPACLSTEMQLRKWRFLSKPYSLPAFLEGIQCMLDEAQMRNAAQR